MSAADRFPLASFATFPYPIVHQSVRGGIRDHVHEYPHADGGAPEKLGRKLYVITQRALFQDRFDAYPGLYPNGLNVLRKIFEEQTTDDLVIPTIGTIRAYCRNWTLEFDSKIRSGEAVDLEFVEDLAQDFLRNDLINPAPLSTSMTSALAAAMDASTLTPNETTLLDSIMNAANAILAISDQSQLVTDLVQAKLASLESLYQQADRLGITQRAEGAGVNAALHDLWAANRQMQNDLLNQQSVSLQTYVTPMTMTVMQISSAVYEGDASHGVDIMGLNAFDDVFRIPANTLVRYYPLAA